MTATTSRWPACPSAPTKPIWKRLIRKGFKVAICEQTEDPAEARKRGSGAVVARNVVRLVTPGTLTEDALLEARRHNYLAVLAEANGAKALAWADISTGEFRVEGVEDGGLPVLLARIEPSELVLPEGLLDGAGFDGAATPLPTARFDSENAHRRLLAAFGVATLEGFGRFDRAQQTACGVLVDYLELTQKGRLPRLEPPRPAGPGQVLEIDPATRRNLELTATLSGERRGSLLATIDRTRSAGGGRLLAAWLAAPLTDPAAIAARHDAVERLCREERLRRDLVGRLARTPDIERSLSRLGLGRGGPRDLAAIRDALALAGEIAGLFDAPPPLLAESCAALRGHEETVGALAAALGPDLPLTARDGGFVAAGYDGELDRLRSLRDDSRKTVAGLQARYASETGARLAQDPAQQHSRLFRRGDADGRRPPASGRRLHSPADHGQLDALHHGRARQVGSADRGRGRAGGCGRTRNLRAPHGPRAGGGRGDCSGGTGARPARRNLRPCGAGGRMRLEPAAGG